MQKVRLIQIPANGGVPVVVRCSMVTRKMTVQEDMSGNAGVFQGIRYQLLQPCGFGIITGSDWIEVSPNELLEPIVFEGAPNDHDPNAPPLGNGGSFPNPVGPGGPVTLGTPIFQVTSAGGNPTAIEVTEWN